MLTALNKFGRPKRPAKSLCLVILLIMLWEVISNIALNRIQPRVVECLSYSQSAYHQGRNSSDIVFCHGFLPTRVHRFQEKIMNTGIDMRSVFVTIKKIKFIEILESFLRQYKICIIRIVLSNTTLAIKSCSNISSTFDTNIGSAQGDDLSKCLFIIYFEKALLTLHYRVDHNHVTGGHSYAVSSKCTLQDECIYEDINFINYCAEKKKDSWS